MNINKKIATLSATALLLVAPLAAMALPAINTPNGNGNIDILGVINAALAFLWPVFIGFAVIMFIIAAFQFFTAQGDPDKVNSARQFVIWGIVGVVVGVLAFTLPFAVQNLLGQNGIT